MGEETTGIPLRSLREIGRDLNMRTQWEQSGGFLDGGRVGNCAGRRSLVELHGLLHVFLDSILFEMRVLIDGRHTELVASRIL